MFSPCGLDRTPNIDGRVNYKAALTLPRRERNMKPVVEHGQGKLLTAEGTADDSTSVTTRKYPRKKFHLGVIIDVKTSRGGVEYIAGAGKRTKSTGNRGVGKCSPCLAK